MNLIHTYLTQKKSQEGLTQKDTYSEQKNSHWINNNSIKYL